MVVRVQYWMLAPLNCAHTAEENRLEKGFRYRFGTDAVTMLTLLVKSGCTTSAFYQAIRKLWNLT